MRLFLTVSACLVMMWGVIYGVLSALSIEQPGGALQLLVSLAVFAIAAAVWMLTEISRQLEINLEAGAAAVDDAVKKMTTSSVAASAGASPSPLPPHAQS